MKLVVISQPTYLPWLGYLDQIDQADHFVVLDRVQFERHSWQHRNRVGGPQGETLLVVPVKRSGLHTAIADVEIADRRAVGKHRRTIEQFYARAPHRDVVLERVAPILDDPPELLIDLNLALLGIVLDLLSITTPRQLASTLAVEASKDELVVSICEALEADAYLAAPGSRGYLEAGGAFARSTVELTFHDFKCVEYPQGKGVFVSHLSAIDALMHVGPAATRELMLRGRRAGG